MARYFLRKKRLGTLFVGVFALTYLCFILLQIPEYNINNENEVEIIKDEVSDNYGIRF